MEQHYSNPRFYPYREGKVEDYLKWVSGETQESGDVFSTGQIASLREAQKTPGGPGPYGGLAENLFADSTGTYYDVSDEMRIAAMRQGIVKSEVGKESMPDYSKEESRGTMEEFQAWVTGKTTPETAKPNVWHSIDWAKREIELLRLYQDDGEELHLFAAPDGKFHRKTHAMEAWERDYKEGKVKSDMATTSTTKTKILDGDHIKLHVDPKDRTIRVPQGETYEGVMTTLAEAKADQEKVIHFGRVFNYRPHDGANATYNVLKRVYGVAIAKPYTVQTPMGPLEIEPELITINVGPHEKATIPWGGLAIPALPGTIVKMQAEKSKLGPVFSIQVDTPKFNKPAVDDLFEQIEQELKTNSIYRGKALVGAWDLEFLDMSKFDAKKIVFSDYVTEALDAALFGTIRNSENLKRAGLPLKRSVLLYGPFGTGKSSIGAITAQVAEQNGWTFLQARTGEDKVEDVLRTAMLYQPAVVFVEDLGEQASALNSSDKISSMLETFDGITSKDSQIVMVMTTNHVENIHKGMLRPGRIDLALEIAGLDRNGTERLFKAVIAPSRLDAHVDYDELYSHMKEWEPAWVRAVADRAQLWAINRAKGSLSYKLTTQDLMNAAISLEPQLELLRKASEGAVIPTLHQAFNEVFENTLHGISLVDDDGDGTGSYLSAHPDNRGSFKR